MVSIDGVRDKLRVLLVSGEPHSGERTWRNLLKSDASVDLVHFTISAPAGKAGRHADQRIVADRLSDARTVPAEDQRVSSDHLRPLCPPGRAADRLFRQYRALCPRRRCGAGGGGPDYASTTSIWRTPLDTVLPAEPVGVTEKPFYAHLSDAGKRHPVTRGLEGSASEPPRWSRFFRTVDTRNAINPPVMTGADGKPLLLLSRFGEGRVASLLSDHIWLWARGFEGGGPHLDLLRRTSHWLMKQPDLDEEALRLQIQGKDLAVLRQTMADRANEDRDLAERRHQGTTLTASEPGTKALHPSCQRTASGRRPTAR